MPYDVFIAFSLGALFAFSLMWEPKPINDLSDESRPQQDALQRVARGEEPAARPARRRRNAPAVSTAKRGPGRPPKAA